MADVTITITKKKRPQRGTASSRPRRGVVRPSKRTDDLGRRRISGGGFINFWDMGQIKDISDNWVTDDFQIIKGATWVSNTFQMNPVDQGDIDAVNAHYNSEDQATIESKYRKIEQPHGRYFSVSLVMDANAEVTNDDNPNWTADGLNVTQAQLDSAEEVYLNCQPVDEWSLRAFRRSTFRVVGGIVFFKGPSKSHITTTFDPLAVAVEFDLKLGDKVFIRPSVTEPFAILWRRIPEWIFAGGILKFAPRNLVDDQELNYLLAAGINSIGTVVDADRMVAQFVGYTGMDFGKKGDLTAIEADIDASEFQTLYDAFTIDPPFDLDVMGYVGDLTQAWAVLVAIVKRGNVLYYCWENI